MFYDSEGTSGGVNIISIKQFYKHRLPISLKMCTDLKKKCVDGTIPKCYQHEYLQLPHSKVIEGKLLQSDDDESSNEEEYFF